MLIAKELKAYGVEELAVLGAVIEVLSNELKAINCCKTAEVCGLGLAGSTAAAPVGLSEELGTLALVLQRRPTKGWMGAIPKLCSVGSSPNFPACQPVPWSWCAVGQHGWLLNAPGPWGASPSCLSIPPAQLSMTMGFCKPV